MKYPESINTSPLGKSMSSRTVLLKETSQVEDSVAKISTPSSVPAALKFETRTESSEAAMRVFSGHRIM